MKSRIHLLLTVVLLLLFAVSCKPKAETEEPVVFGGGGPEYFSTLKILDAKQSQIYRAGLPDKEENRAIIQLNEERLRLACLNASVSGEALRAVRDNADKLTREQMLQVYNGLRADTKKSQLGRAMKAYTEKKAVLVGDPLLHFEGVGLDGKPFDWSVTEGKRVLLIYEGWGWIKRSTHLWFKDLLSATDRDSLAVVAYVYAGSMAEFQKRVKAFQLEPYRVVSDLQGKEGPLDKKMGIHGIPTYYYTDRQGIVRRIVAGFEPDRFTMST
ncbi:MAG: hypothetical protein J5702_04270, partial [Bacteroidales bacterium]|nr:hypothetical protein [Bacteroidales bacterium]